MYFNNMIKFKYKNSTLISLRKHATQPADVKNYFVKHLVILWHKIIKKRVGGNYCARKEPINLCR